MLVFDDAMFRTVLAVLVLLSMTSSVVVCASEACIDDCSCCAPADTVSFADPLTFENGWASFSDGQPELPFASSEILHVPLP